LQIIIIYLIFERMPRERINKRVITIKHSDSPLTSERVGIILSSPVDSKRLANAVRAVRRNDDKENKSFGLTDETRKKIESAEARLARVR